MQNLNSFKVLSLLLKQLGIPVTQTSIITELQKHSDAGSLRAFSDLLDRWSVPNAAYQVSTAELVETEIPLPFIACFKKSEFVLVTQKSTAQFVISNERWVNHVVTIEEFKNQHLGSILAVEKDKSSGELDYSAKRRREIIEKLRIPFVISGAIIILFAHLLINPNYLATFNWHIGLLMLFKALGLITSIFLLIQSINANNPLIKKVCGNDSNKNCNAILSSNAAKLVDGLSWSEIGFFYFAGSWLALLFNFDKGNVIQILAMLNLISLPYTFYSIYYQWQVAKQWCVFCCLVQALLWFEFFAFLPYLSDRIQLLDLSQWSSLLTAMLAPILFWVLLKPYLLGSEQLKLLRPELFRFKYNKELVQNMFHNETKYSLLPEEDTIILGNREADKVITLVSNPFCIHCSKTHKLLDALLEVRDDIKLQLVFVGRIRERETDKKVMGHFMALQLGKNEAKLRDAINDWYKHNEKNYERWKEKYPVQEIAFGSEMLSKQKEWCGTVKITSTPTLFINGRRLPPAYQPEDIQFLI
jgi:uncharacterized membrane protein/glutaredoxin